MRRLSALPVALSASAILAACGAPDSEEAVEQQTAEAVQAEPASEAADAAPQPVTGALSDAVEGEWREDAARARDAARRPMQTLEFFGIDPSGSVMEIWPGGGWYTDILAPWTAANGGTYIAAWPPVDPSNERAVAFRDRFTARFDDARFGAVNLAEFGPETGPLVEPGSIDAIVTFRNTHSFMGRGMAEKAFADFFAALRPGGTLGLVQHRLPADQVQDPRAGTGYVQQDYVIALAEEAGFELVEASEINANPADTADHPFGVWTLPPVGRTSAFGEPANPEFDRAPYDAIGESDRMTLRFRKPETGGAEATE